MRGQIARAARSEARGVKAEVESRSIYAGLLICISLFIVLFVVEYLVFG